MTITFDAEFATDGTFLGAHKLDTADPQVQTMLAALKGNPAAIAKAGFGDATKLPPYPGKTRWEVIEAEVIALDDKPARAILGV